MGGGRAREQDFPAEQYMLGLCGHGNGWAGFGGDQRCNASQAFGDCTSVMSLEAMEAGVREVSVARQWAHCECEATRVPHP